MGTSETSSHILGAEKDPDFTEGNPKRSRMVSDSLHQKSTTVPTLQFIYPFHLLSVKFTLVSKMKSDVKNYLYIY
jgi:hypothetical protein